MAYDVSFKAPRVITDFMQSNARFRLLHGPFRSGKSVGSMVEIPRRAAMQAPDKNGKRRTRWAVIRNTMPQLRDTTMKTWFDWFPDGSCGYYRETGKTFYMKFGDVESEIMFRALDDASDVKNLLSLELTGAYINEARGIPREIVEGLDGRISQYPKMADGGCTWAGIWADTNPPEEGSYWWSMMEGLDPDTGEPRPNDWAVFRQPGGLIRVPESEQCDVILRCGWHLRANPDADNVENLVPGYYTTLARDKSDEYVKTYIMAMYMKSKGGKPVHPLFDQDYHVAGSVLLLNPKLPLVLSADFGLTPAISFQQQDAFGRLLVLDEVVTEHMGLKRALSEKVKPLLNSKYRDAPSIFVTGDPSGANGSQNDESSCLDIFREAGFKRVKLAYSNNPVHRTNDLDTFLMRRTEQGAGFLVSPQCAYTIRGLAGGYHYKLAKNGVASADPEKNIFSHICEATQYGAMHFSKHPSQEGDTKDRNAWLSQVNNRQGGYMRRNS